MDGARDLQSFVSPLDEVACCTSAPPCCAHQQRTEHRSSNKFPWERNLIKHNADGSRSYTWATKKRTSMLGRSCHFPAGEVGAGRACTAPPPMPAASRCCRFEEVTRARPSVACPGGGRFVCMTLSRRSLPSPAADFLWLRSSTPS